MYETIYEPAEDSFMMEKILKKKLQHSSNLMITEVGVGSGFVFSELVKEFPKNIFSGTDINPDAILATQKRLQNTKANLYLGNLLEPIREKQDLIFFNTPYLPLEQGEKYNQLTLKDKAIYGGKHGYEIIYNFIDQLYDKLKINGSVVMLFSSLSKEQKIKEKLELEGYQINNIYREKHFMEELIIYEFSKNNILKELEQLEIKQCSYLTKGKHSIIYQGKFHDNEVICKTSQTHFTDKETLFLKKLQNKDFVPKLYVSTKSIQIMEKCQGNTIKEFLERSNKETILKILQRCLDICFELDQLGYQKFELTNPYKHIFISKNFEVKFIDFERTIHTENPKNTTQFLQYIRRNIPLLKTKDIVIEEEEILKIANLYKLEKNKISLCSDLIEF